MLNTIYNSFYTPKSCTFVVGNQEDTGDGCEEAVD